MIFVCSLLLLWNLCRLNESTLVHADLNPWSAAGIFPLVLRAKENYCQLIVNLLVAY